MKSPIHELKKQSTRFLSRTTRTFFLVTAVILPSLLITSCVPPPVGGGTPSPTNLFNVSLSLAGKYPTLNTEDRDTITTKTINIDGDEIGFAIDKYYGTTPGMAHSEFRAYIKFPNENYEFLRLNDSIPSSASCSYNTTISNTSIPIHSEWNSLNQFIAGWPYEFGTGLGYSSGAMSLALINIEGLPLNEYRYWVFRKPKNGSYLYFWVKVIGIPDNMIAPNTVTIKIENGRYQMDNITTGQ